jgi:hypothetical protein
MSPAPVIDPDIEDVIIESLTKIMGRAVCDVEPLLGGRNSRVVAFAIASGDRYVAKLSRPSVSDRRDRLGTEFQTLSFLWREGVRQIPEPAHWEQEAGILISRRLDGHKISTKELTFDDLDQFVFFLIELQNFQDQAKRTEWIGRASEACFSRDELMANLRWRVERLRSVVAGEPELKKFIENDLSPRLRKAEESRDAGELPLGRRILSPSDFGTHNALKGDDTVFRFFDFEYFGWDDPAKTIADFCLHPAMGLDGRQRRHFAKALMSGLKHGEELPARLSTYFSLYGLKWCLILLNEFLPEVYSRREAAGGEKKYGDRKEVQSQQLAKARAMLCTIDTAESDLQ